VSGPESGDESADESADELLLPVQEDPQHAPVTVISGAVIVIPTLLSSLIAKAWKAAGAIVKVACPFKLQNALSRITCSVGEFGETGAGVVHDETTPKFV